MRTAIITYLFISIAIPLQQQFEIKSCTTTWKRDKPNIPETASNLTEMAIRRRHSQVPDYEKVSEHCQEYGFFSKAIRRVNPITRVQSLHGRIF
jgi:hypothetical protein